MSAWHAVEAAEAYWTYVHVIGASTRRQRGRIRSRSRTEGSSSSSAPPPTWDQGSPSAMGTRDDDFMPSGRRCTSIVRMYRGYAPGPAMPAAPASRAR